MDEAKKEERRKALAELAELRRRGEPLPVSLSPAPAAPAASTPPAKNDFEEQTAEDELDWDLDTTGERSDVSLDAAPADPSTDTLDSGWDDEEEEEEEPEPELPDERLDPVAYAEAKAAQAERLQARKERKRAKDAAKKERQRARALAAKNKQKIKSRKSRAPSRVPAPPKKAKPSRSVASVEQVASQLDESRAEQRAGVALAAPKKSTTLAKAKPAAGLSQTNKLILAVVVAGFVAAAIYAAYAHH